MNKLIFYLVFLMTGFINGQKVTLTIQTNGFKNNDGKVRVGVYNSEGHFLNETFMNTAAEIKNGKATVVFKEVPVGTYAVSIYHDENNSGVLERGMFGIPKEDTACSNNAKGKMGPPKYEDAKFKLTADQTIEITLNK